MKYTYKTKKQQFVLAATEQAFSHAKSSEKVSTIYNSSFTCMACHKPIAGHVSIFNFRAVLAQWLKLHVNQTGFMLGFPLHNTCMYMIYFYDYSLLWLVACKEIAARPWLLLAR